MSPTSVPAVAFNLFRPQTQAPRRDGPLDAPPCFAHNSCGVPRAPPASPPVLAARWAGRFGTRTAAMTRRLLGPVFVASLLVATRLNADAPKTPVAHAPDSPIETLTVFPAEIALDGPRAEQRLGVLAVHADGRQWDHSRAATFASSDSKIVSVGDAGIIRPISDGRATVTVTAGGQSATVRVTVTHSTAEEPVNFTREIEAVLTKAGCNQGACHGAQLGRGGFRLSLFGFDPVFDHSQIVQSAEGR